MLRKYRLPKNPSPPEPKTLHNWNEFLADIRYKPDWRINVVCPIPSAVYNLQIQFHYSAPDAYHSGQIVHAMYSMSLRPCYTEAEMLDELARHIIKAERHEIGEFIVYRGEHPYNPHDPSARKLPIQ